MVHPSRRHRPRRLAAARSARISACAVGSPTRSRWLPAADSASSPRATTAPTGTSPHDRQRLASSSASAREAGLRYVTDARPGIGRRRRGTGFTYLGPDGKVVRDPETLARIRSLAVPPAWTEVWICPGPRGHLQATG